ncbi:MAG: BRO family protein [Promethearchaeota archaeon]
MRFLYLNDEWWVTAETIGKGLEYKNPRKSIMNLYYSHKDEIEDFKGVIETMTPGGSQETTIFNEQGIYLLIMFSNQPKAKQFRKWIISVIKEIRLKGYYLDKSLEPIPLTNRISDLRTYVKSLNIVTGKGRYFHSLIEKKRKLDSIFNLIKNTSGISIKELTNELSFPRTTLSYHLKKLYKKGLIIYEITHNGKKGRPYKIYKKAP